MSSHIVHPGAGNGKVQTGPVYHCPQCGAACQGILTAEQAHAPFGGAPPWMRDWTDHVGYLDRPARCRRERHFGARVVRLGAAILPVDWPDHTPNRDKIAAIRRALDRIARQVGPQGAPHDPAASIVYRLLAGVLTPQRAIENIREFARLGALDAPEPILAQEVSQQ
jgi:hypothetical protein